MTRVLLLLSIALSTLFVRQATAQSVETFYDEVDRFLAKHVHDGSVAYRPIQAKPNDLDALIALIGALPVARLDDADRKAVLINAYNLFTIQQVVTHYPIASPLDVLDFFDRPAFTLEGKRLSLNTLEKTELFARYPDPRMHFVLVCAAAGCPSLTSVAYRGATIDAQLDVRTRLALDDPKHIKNGARDGDLNLSELFSWYQADFSREGSVIDYINRFRTHPIAPTATISYIPYDWRLNDLGGSDRR
ncbi:MAG: DUF547 domain-containing protein [Rhodothermales bacterium]|nr:DUF547 domain-containing protein [Rhodothermales bacterium]